MAGKQTDARGVGWIAQHRHSFHVRHYLLKQRQPFRAEAVLKRSKAGGVAPRSRQAIDKPGADRIGDVREHDRHRGRGPLQWADCRAAGGDDDVRSKRDQFGRVFPNLVGIANGAPPIVDLHIAADGPSQLLQPL